MTPLEALIERLRDTAPMVARAALGGSVFYSADDERLLNEAADALSAALRVTEPMARYAAQVTADWPDTSGTAIYGVEGQIDQLTLGQCRAIAHWRQTGRVKDRSE